MRRPAATWTILKHDESLAFRPSRRKVTPRISQSDAWKALLFLRKARISPYTHFSKTSTRRPPAHAKRAQNQGKPHEMTKAHVVTPERKRLVEAGASWGVNHGNIAKILRISTRTLEKKYRHELDVATDELVIKTGARLTKQALSKGDTAPNTQARLFIMRTRGNAKETSDLNVSHKYAPRPNVVIRLPRNGFEHPSIVNDPMFYDATPEQLNPALLIEHKAGKAE